MSLVASDSDMQREINRGALEQFWDTLSAGEVVAQIYREDAILRIPQAGLEITGRTDIAAHGPLEDGEQLVRVRSIIGDEWLWVSDCETRYRQNQTLLVSVAEMRDGKIIRETRYRAPMHTESHVAPSS